MAARRRFAPEQGGGRISCSRRSVGNLTGMAKELFGTDGIRGIPGEYPLDDRTLNRVGVALGGYLRSPGDRPGVLIGRDTRESGPHIAEQIACGLRAAGPEPVSAGVLTTPGVAWLV